MEDDEGKCDSGILPRQFASMVMLETEYDKVLKGEDISRRDYIIEEKRTRDPSDGVDYRFTRVKDG